MTPPKCSTASIEAGESLAATALEAVDSWFLLEVTDPWAPKPLESEAFSESVRDRLALWSQRPRSRLQLIRRPGRSGKRPLLMVVSSAPDRRGGAIRELDRYEDILDIDLDALGLEPIEPICLVCAHGRRDRCCGLLGSAVFRAIQAEQVDVWQTSHLGGHRFAACALWLPQGSMHGRLRPKHASAFVAAQKAAELGDLDLFRGNCAYDRPTQAAEILLRRELDNLGVDAVEWKSTTQVDESSWEARFNVASMGHAVRVRMNDTGLASPQSCGKPPEPITEFVAG